MSYQHSFELLDDFVVWHGQDGVGGVVVDLGEVADRRGTLHGAAVPTAVTAGLAATTQAPGVWEWDWDVAVGMRGAGVGVGFGIGEWAVCTSYMAMPKISVKFVQ